MIVNVTSTEDSFELVVNNKFICYADNNDCDSPEDMILGRNLSFITEIPDLLQKAYDAGKNGEEFVITYE